MTWYYNRKVKSTFVHHTTQWAWAEIDGLGWRRIKDGAADGVTNMFVMMCAARANERLVHVDVDASNLIVTAYMI
ncbi:MAG: hypothetical protein GKC10_07930 [Methanosarcinales archaeon]|nr:hypothetical protein [Methanosarcinales archaeon]